MNPLCPINFIFAYAQAHWYRQKTTNITRYQVNTSAGHHILQVVLAHTTFPGVTAGELLSLTDDSRGVDSGILIQASLQRNISFSLLRNIKAERLQNHLIVPACQSSKKQTYCRKGQLNPILQLKHQKTRMNRRVYPLGTCCIEPGPLYKIV